MPVTQCGTQRVRVIVAKNAPPGERVLVQVASCLQLAECVEVEGEVPG
jgi:hypothetical protein